MGKGERQTGRERKKWELKPTKKHFSEIGGQRIEGGSDRPNVENGPRRTQARLQFSRPFVLETVREENRSRTSHHHRLFSLFFVLLRFSTSCIFFMEQVLRDPKVHDGQRWYFGMSACVRG